MSGQSRVRRFGKRLDGVLERMAETSMLLPQRGRLKLITLKMIFDNLRCYGVLAFMWVGVRVLRDDGGWWTWLASWVLGLVTLTLGVLTAFQSSFLIIGGVLGVCSALLEPRFAVRIRRKVKTDDRALNLLVYTLGIGICASLWILGGGLMRALARAGLL